MCMVMLHEWRGIPLQHLEEALVAPLLGRKEAAREYARQHPGFNPFELIGRFGGELFGWGETEKCWPSAFMLDAERVAVAVAEQRRVVTVRYWVDEFASARNRDAYIVAVEPGCISVFVPAARRVMGMWWEKNHWEGHAGLHHVSFSWKHDSNPQLLLDVERTLVGQPVRMRTRVEMYADMGDAEADEMVDADEDHNVA